MSDAGSRVLVVDDDPGVRQAVTRALRFEGYEVSEGKDGLEALELVDDADVLLVDVTMPNMNGFEVCRRLRATGSDLPVLVLTARHATADRVEGLDAGADDYLVKPFALEELLARVRALLRRRSPAGAGQGASGDSLAFAGLTMDRQAREVRRSGDRIELTRTEYTLLELLLEHPNQVLSRDQIYEAVWGYDSSMASNSLEVYVGYLRRKTEAGGLPRLVHTMRGVGYVLREA